MKFLRTSFLCLLRSSHRRCSIKRFQNIHRKTLELESLFKKVAGFQYFNCIPKRLQHRYFPVDIAKFLKALKILKNILEPIEPHESLPPTIHKLDLDHKIFGGNEVYFIGGMVFLHFLINILHHMSCYLVTLVQSYLVQNIS